MKKYFWKNFIQLGRLLLLTTIGLTFYPACSDIYPYDDGEPTWLGSSIYESLKEKGDYTNFVKLIDDLKYTETLSLTGSRTVFVANDSAFAEFYKSNPWGVKSYDGLTLQQKKYLMNFSMLKNAYVLEKLANYYDGVLNEGTAMRRTSFLAAVDSVGFEFGSTLPANPYWDYFHLKGMYLVKDETAKSLVYFFTSFLEKYSITDDDFAVLTNGERRAKGDVYVFDNKIVSRDLTCKNGYVHQLKNVLTPPMNMAEYICANPNTKVFSKLLDRFCAPFYSVAITGNYKTLHPEFVDSIYVKKYFATNGGTTYLPTAQHIESTVTAKNLLKFDPGWNAYKVSTSISSDMAALFVPTDKAMNDYFDSPVGVILKSRFGTWENVPDEIILPLVNRHMRVSLIESVPSKFDKMVDEANYKLPVEKNHIEKTYLGVNGAVYTTNQVYPPVDYISVYGPVLFSASTKIMNWAINISEKAPDGSPFAFYKLYLNSLESKYNLFIPTDDSFTKYIDPIAYGQEKQAVLKFWYNDKTYQVNATVYKYDKITKLVGDSIGVIASTGDKNDFIVNRLWEVLDNHIILGELKSSVANDTAFYVTKGNGVVRTVGEGTNLQVHGGGDIENETTPSITKTYNQENGNTYFMNKPVESGYKSVYDILQSTPEFSEFFNLVSSVPDTCKQQILEKQGISYRIKFFNAFRYTVYVPTNRAITDALANNVIKSWTDIAKITVLKTKSAEVAKLLRFIKCHFQDNAVYYGQSVNETYQSATIKTDNVATHFGTYNTKYYKIGVSGSKNSLQLTLDTPKKDLLGNDVPVRTVNVLPIKGFYNIIAKDYYFSKKPTEFLNVDGTGTGTAAYSTSRITSSASAIIHQVDNVMSIE